MAPIDRSEVSALSDEELSDELKQLGVDVGPVNAATRRTYENKLFKLRTGQASIPSRYEPVDDDDDDDDEVILKKPAPQVQYQTPPPTQPSQPRQRQVYDSHIPTPRGDSMVRPSLYNDRKVTSTAYTPTRASAGSRYSQAGPQSASPAQSSGAGIPKWVMVVALSVVAVLVYLIYVNMESASVLNIPHIPSKVEV